MSVLRIFLACFEECKVYISTGIPTKRYKVYEYDSNISVPKTTQWRIRTETGNKSLETTPGLSDESLTDMYVSDHDTDSNCDVQINLPTDDDENSEDDINYLISESESDASSSSDEDASFEHKSTLSNDVSKDPPLYVIPPSNTLYKSRITRSEHLCAISAYVTRHNLSDAAFKDLLDIIQLHLPEKNIGETNINNVKESCGFNPEYIQYHLYCENCKMLYDDDNEDCKTPGCTGSKTKINSKNYFMTGNLNIQLTEILERDGVWESITEQRMSVPEHISDVRGGEEYKKMLKPGGFLHSNSNITLSLFIDGIPLFKSSSVSLWPVYVLINEIPPKSRFQRKNMILWGIWQGVGKPNMNMFLKPLVVDLMKLYHNGIQIKNSCSNEKEIVRARLIIATMDLQARAYVLMMTHHNGLYGCLYCLEPGEVVKSGKGTCRSYINREQPTPARSDESARNCAQIARQSGKRTEGFLGESVLWYLSYFSVTNSVVIDYMHGTLLGVCKKLLELWFDKSYSSETFNITTKVDEVDKILKNIKPPYTIHRKPRVLKSTFSNWKASEHRNWLLFYSLPCLKDRLPDIYVIHFSCLVEAIYVLLQEGITSNDIRRARLLLTNKVKKENSYTIQLERHLDNDTAVGIEVSHYIMSKSNSKRTFAVGRLFYSDGFIFPQRVPHLQKITFKRKECDDVVPAEHLKEPLMIVDNHLMASITVTRLCSL
ncbi:hypothetical protein KUTeg_002736 [Tegillarca granosa]|uniref:Uncharacterized protein n=1 Tax=Tegillarca granosa TaxID=220873 RepID=A0ABQ9FR60_TEGGR|nr:hypothetical protein KUTeg_002736 [Tegillarca granosa]